MQRREFFRAAGAAGLGLVVVGGHCGRNLYARHQLESQLIREIDPLFMKQNQTDHSEIPRKGRHAIRTWFHGPCLNAAEFAAAITSDGFRQRVAACPTVERQHAEFLIAFEAYVVTAEAVMAQVRQIARELGDELDNRWNDCCQNVAAKWKVHIDPSASSLPSNFAASLEPLIRRDLTNSLALAQSAGQRPALQQTIGTIGESALLMLPMARVAIASRLFWPLFLLVAVGHLFSYLSGLWSAGRSRQLIRTAVSERMTLLADRIGDEFERALTQSIGQLHTWQHRAVTMAAQGQAERAISLF